MPARLPAGIREQFGEAELSVCLTGSVGMGIAERWSLPFVQEVVAATQYIRIYHPDVSTMIDIGGEDAKMVFFSEGHPSDLRMNGNCAGGTGAFIDQMAILLGVSPEELGALAESATQVYPIGVPVRCVLQDRHPEPDCAQRLPGRHCRLHLPRRGSTDSHHIGARARNQRPCLALRRAVVLHPGPAESLCRIPRPAAGKPDPARQSQPDTRMGSSLDKKRTDTDRTGSDPADRWKPALKGQSEAARLAPIFGSREEYEAWKKQMSQHAIERAPWPTGPATVFLGIDSGSTTTKIAVLDRKGRMLFSHYRNTTATGHEHAQKQLLIHWRLLN